MKKTYKKIGEILIESGLINKARLDEALRYQAEFGGNITQYLIDHDYVKEEDVAKSISFQFGCPYLPLRAYEIKKEISDLIPPYIAEKYWAIPIDKIENIVTVVMANPLDEEAIKTLEKITKCEVQPFVGLLSDIAKAIEHYYDVVVEDEALAGPEKKAPLFIRAPSYAGIDRRKSIRIKCGLNIHFVDPNLFNKTNYIKAETKDVSSGGFLFESSNMLPVNSFLNLGIHVPEDISAYPIYATAQVVRVEPLKGGKFDVGVKIMSIRKSDIHKIIKYALAAGPARVGSNLKSGKANKNVEETG